MKKIITRCLLIICVLMSLVVVTSCKKESMGNYASSTIVGQITSISDSTINLTLGELTTNSQSR